MITSTFPIPTVTAISTLPAAAYQASPSYDLNIVGTNFSRLGPPGNPSIVLPKFYVLTSSETQSEITVTSVTWLGATNIKASIVLSTFVNAGVAYDVRVVMPDGQEYPSLYDRNGSSSAVTASNKPLGLLLPKPTISVPDMFGVRSA